MYYQKNSQTIKDVNKLQEGLTNVDGTKCRSYKLYADGRKGLKRIK